MIKQKQFVASVQGGIHQNRRRHVQDDYTEDMRDKIRLQEN